MTKTEMVAIHPPVLWRRLDVPGHESARLSQSDGNYILEGTSIFVEQEQPCRLNYQIVCDPGWRTSFARIDGWVGERAIELQINVDAGQIWRMNGVEWPGVAGCLDLDLNFSPSTNLLPIRRSALQIGQSVIVTAAWLRFPGFTLEPLAQTYQKTGPSIYHYESAGGSFTAELTTNPAGLVVDYPPVWTLATFRSGHADQ